MFAKDYLLIIFGISLYGLGFCAFIATAPDKVVIGGMAGLSQVVDMVSYGVFGFHIPYSVTIFTVNILMLVMAYKIVGRTFVIRTLFGVVVISTVFALFQPLFTKPPVEGQTFMDIIIGAVLCGLGIGLVFIHNGSTGGTDIVAAVASKKSNVSIGRAMMYFDLSVISSSMLLKALMQDDFSFQEAVPALVYGLITLFVIPFMADSMINTNRMAVQFTIFRLNGKRLPLQSTMRPRGGARCLTVWGGIQRRMLRCFW